MTAWRLVTVIDGISKTYIQNKKNRVRHSAYLGKENIMEAALILFS